MKKVLGFVTVSLFSFTMLMAQQTSFGLKAGLNVASLETSGLDYGGKAGLHVGGLAHIHINKHLAFQPELVYSMQGGQEGNAEWRLNYINIPLLLQYMASEGLRLETGPQLGLLTSAEFEQNNLTVDVKEGRSTTEFSWAFGVGYLFPQGWGLDGRFNLGLSNVNDDDNLTIKNRVFQLGVFYQFMQNKKAKKK